MSNAAVTIAPNRRTTNDSRLDGDATAFGELRSRLMGIAYRILGSWSEAEDVVQDAWLRWQCYDRTTVVNPTAFLVTTTTRLAINATQSARARRESYVGQWLPEPVAPSDDPALVAEHIDVLEVGILLLLERLGPTERAAYVLHEAFGYPYPRIAQILQTTNVNARQLVSRARKRMATSRRRPANRDGHRRLLHAFVAAARHGDIDDLEQFLADDVVGLGPRRTQENGECPVTGRCRAALSDSRFSRTFRAESQQTSSDPDSPAAALLSHNGRSTAVVTTAATPAGIDQVLCLVNSGRPPAEPPGDQ